MDREHSRGRVDSAVRLGVPDQLLDDVYEELRRLAKSYLRNERSGHTLQPTALVHEAYLRLGAQKNVEWQCRSHFFAVGARMMRRVLVDHARGRGRAKRGGDWQRLFLNQVGGDDLHAFVGGDVHPDDLLDLSLRLDSLSEVDPRAAEVVELRFFGGLTVAEIADLLGVSTRTVDSDWAYARAWLRRALTRGEPS